MIRFNRAIRILEIIASPNGYEVRVEVAQEDGSRMAIIPVDPECGRELKRITESQPFKKLSEVPYEYWISGGICGIKPSKADRSLVVRSNPRMSVYTVRGKSRQQDVVGCSPQFFDEIQKIKDEILILMYGKEKANKMFFGDLQKTYTWANTD